MRKRESLFLDMNTEGRRGDASSHHFNIITNPHRNKYTGPIK